MSTYQLSIEPEKENICVYLILFTPGITAVTLIYFIQWYYLGLFLVTVQQFFLEFN